MTVDALIQKLLGLPPDLPVVGESYDQLCEEVIAVERHEFGRWTGDAEAVVLRTTDRDDPLYGGPNRG